MNIKRQYRLYRYARKHSLPTFFKRNNDYGDGIQNRLDKLNKKKDIEDTELGCSDD